MNSNALAGMPEGFNAKEYKPSLFKHYQEVIVHYMMKKYDLKNIMRVPKIEKIVISAAISNLKHGKEDIKKIYNSLYLATGVLPVLTKGKMSISQFKLYKGSIVGAKVVLRKHYIYEFIERLVNIYLPNIKGFLGIKYSSLQHNSLNIGIKDAHIIKEIGSYLGMMRYGFTITIHFSNVTKDVDVACDFLKQFEIPIKKEL